MKSNESNEKQWKIMKSYDKRWKRDEKECKTMKMSPHAPRRNHRAQMLRESPSLLSTKLLIKTPIESAWPRPQGRPLSTHRTPYSEWHTPEMAGGISGGFLRATKNDAKMMPK